MRPARSLVVVSLVILVSLAALVAATLIVRRRSRNVVALKMAHSLDVTHPVHKAMEFMAQRLKEKSGGRMLIQVFPNEQLGSERVVIEQLQLGCLDMTKTSVAPMEGFIPEMGVFSVPYVFKDSDHFWRVLDGAAGKVFLEAGCVIGLRGLCYYDSGSRSFYTRQKMIRTPDDLAGMKIRVMQSKTSMAMVRALGGSPTPIDWGELYTSLQQGVVDGAENNPPSLHTSRHYEVCKFYSLDEHTMIPDIVLVSSLVWDRLTAEQQRLLQEAADESSAFQRRLWREKTEESLARVQEAGVEIHRPDKGPFREKVAAMQESYEGTPIGAALKMIRETP